VGLAVIATAGPYGAAQIIAIDLDQIRLDFAKRVGATHCVRSGSEDWKEQGLALTDGYGVDVAVEAVGLPATFDMCIRLVRPRVATWRTSACTASPYSSTCKTCGSRTSISAWDS
jgi:alcohol dehydrogenase